MKMYPLEVKNDNPNGTLSAWLSSNQDNYDIHAIVLRDEDNGKLFWHIYYVS